MGSLWLFVLLSLVWTYEVCVCVSLSPPHVCGHCCDMFYVGCGVASCVVIVVDDMASDHVGVCRSVCIVVCVGV